MHKEIIINSDPKETRVAILEDKQLVELLAERPEERRIIGDIYKGKINAVLPGMQAAFVDIGLAKTAFLHASDLAASLREDIDFDDDDAPQNGNSGGGGRGRGGRGGPRRRPRREATPKIEEHLTKGQEVTIQITKEPISTKGPRVTQQVSLPGRYVVFMPGLDHVGVSRKIPGRDERLRLKKILREIKPKGAGLIVRTAGEGKTKKDFKEDVNYLVKMWKKIERRSVSAPSPALVHREMSLATGLIRDLLTEDVNEVVVDGNEVFHEIQEYLKNVSPELIKRVRHYDGKLPIFDAFRIESDIEKLFERKVWLKRGGYIIIDQAEALVAIDINTGRFVGKKNQEETILKTNIEAAREISRQLRLRDLGGIIVIDFIDMESEGNKKAVLEELRKHLKRDRSRTKTFAVSDLGLVEMTRQRERPSLLSYLSDDCNVCGGVGKVMSLQSVALKVERLLTRIGVNTQEDLVELRVSPEMAHHLFAENSERLASLEKMFKFQLDVRDDPRLRRSHIKVIFPRTNEDVTDRFRP
ncbi:MAG: Rne/Rng family ribonuclease [Candidatus Eisenbacteria bacterium]|uniref:Ribonuclease G n=1 Tax=Eiseniibacteriota bacterium TaxID=2212470 RepID=A0A7Y2E899_UNCEI|nr:Rne/Rng family ribonuclease [Candidatus Eisenbacteria bacterium]